MSMSGDSWVVAIFVVMLPNEPTLPDNYSKNSWCSRLGLTLVGFSDVDGVLNRSSVVEHQEGRLTIRKLVGWVGSFSRAAGSMFEFQLCHLFSALRSERETYTHTRIMVP
jgi:hypothetical protein